MQIKGKIYIFDKDFNAFFSAPDRRKKYIPQSIPKTQPL